MISQENLGTKLSVDFLHENTCGLEETGHQINEEFIHVIKEVKQNIPIECEFFASGCGSCTPDIEPRTAAIFYIAQGSAVETVHLCFDIIGDNNTEEHERNTKLEIDDSDETFSVEDLGTAITEAAENQNVAVSWTGDVSEAVCLGTDKAYYTFPPGVEVKSTEPHNDWTATTVEANDEDWCPTGYTKIKFDDGGAAIKSSRKLEALSEL